MTKLLYILPLSLLLAAATARAYFAPWSNEDAELTIRARPNGTLVLRDANPEHDWCSMRARNPNRDENIIEWDILPFKCIGYEFSGTLEVQMDSTGKCDWTAYVYGTDDWDDDAQAYWTWSAPCDRYSFLTQNNP